MFSLPRQPLLSAALAAAFGAGSTVWSPIVAAQPSGQAATQVFEVKVPAQTLAAALNELSRQTGVQVFASGELVAGIGSRAVAGRLTMERALREMLAGTSLEAVRTANGGFSIHRTDSARGPDGTLPQVIVAAQTDEESATGPVRGYLAKRSATGTKTDTPIIEVPQSISVVTAERAEAIGATRIRDALGYSPGVNIAPYGSDSRHDWVFLRGFDAFSPGFYLDGLQMRNANTLSTWRTELYGAERVELLRGPSSVLYGQNTAGGMVNVVSKRPTTEPLHEIRAQVGEHSRREIAGDFSGPLDQEGKWLYRLTGLINEGEIPLAGGLRDDRSYIAPSLTWRPSSDTSLTLLASYLRVRTTTSYRYLPIAGTLQSNPNGPIPLSTFLGEPNRDHYNLDQWMLGYQFEHRINDTWTVRQNTRYGRLDVDYATTTPTGGFVTVNSSQRTDPLNFRYVTRRFSSSPEEATSFTIDNQVQAKFRTGDAEHTLLVGLDHQRTHFDTKTYRATSTRRVDVYAPTYGENFTLPSTPVSSYDIKLQQTGFYVQDQIKFGEHWIATLGGRYDSADINTTNRVSNTVIDKTDHKFSGRAGLVYLHPSGWAPYLSYSESFSPTTNAYSRSNALFEPETGQQYEAGIRYQPVGRKDSYSAAIFDVRRQNYVTYDLNSVARQTGEIRVHGLELEATVQPIPNLNLTASYAWTPKADVTASSTPSEIGKQLNPVSKHQASLWGDYRFSNGVKFGMGVRYTGPNNGFYESIRVPGYTLVDAMIGYDFGRWSLALHARNLTNKAYIATADLTTGYAYPGEPRSVTATATYRW